MSWIIVDVEADGPCPGLYSMVSFGAVVLKDTSKTFYGTLKPISENYIPEALAVSNVSREDHLQFDDPKETMIKFSSWIEQNSSGRATFVSDNPAFDWQFINYYFHKSYKRRYQLGTKSCDIREL